MVMAMCAMSWLLWSALLTIENWEAGEEAGEPQTSLQHLRHRRMRAWLARRIISKQACGPSRDCIWVQRLASSESNWMCLIVAWLCDARYGSAREVALALIPAMLIGGASAAADPGALPTHGPPSATAPSSAVLTPVENNSTKIEFALRACNRTRNSIWVSIGAREEGEGGAWYVAGWWQVLPLQCRLLGKFPRPMIYLHAQNSAGRLWNGTDARLCVNAGNFKYIYDPNKKCAEEMLRGFYKKIIDRAWTSFEWRVGQ